MSAQGPERGAGEAAAERTELLGNAAKVGLDLAEVIFVGIGPDERVVLINRKGAEVLGVPKAEIVGKPWFDTFVPARLRAEIKPLFHKLMTGEMPVIEIYESPVITAGGEERLIAWHSGLLRDEAGAVIAALSSGSDITERRRAEEAERALQRSESVLRSFYNSAPYFMGIAELLDDDLRIVSCNAAGADYYQRPLSEIVGRTLRELGRVPEDVGPVAEKYREALRRSAPVHFRFKRSVGARPRALQVVIAPLAEMSAEGKPLFSFVTEDITEREEMQSRVLLSDRMASLGTLAAGVAHEINNPLAYVLNNLEIIASRLASHEPHGGSCVASDDLTNAVAQAREGVERVSQIVKGLRTFSRGDDDRLTPLIAEDAIESAVKIAWNEIRHRAGLVRDYGASPAVMANEARLVQLFLNLLLNAAHAIPEGHARSNTIRVATRTDDRGRMIAEISDTGSGIPPEIIDRIFEPFFTTRPVGEGMGLGLAVCHGIVKALGGEITVESEFGKGTTFRVALDATTAPVHAKAGASTPPPSLRRGKIIVIDDEPLLRMSLRSLLSSEHDVTTASSAREALAKVAAGERFDVLLCDLMMPEMTGMDLYDNLATVAPDQTSRMVFLTGGVFTARAQAFVDRVKNTCMEKPFEINALRDVIQKLLV